MTDSFSDEFDFDDDFDHKHGIRRVNNIPIYIVIAVAILFVITMVGVMYHRSQKQQLRETQETLHASESTDQASQIIGKHQSGFIMPEVPSLTAQEASTLPTPTAQQAPPLPLASQDTHEQDEQRIALENELKELRNAKLELIKTAISAKSQVALISGQNRAGIDANADPLIALKAAIDNNTDEPRDPIKKYQQTMASLKAAGLLPSSSGQPSDQDADPYQGFDHSGNGNRWTSSYRIESPESPYVLRAGFVIPGTLISGIGSDSPGQIVAQVSQDVYDTGTGRHLLIPLGSRLVGSYDNDIAYGQQRLLVAWQRIVFPDGKALDLGAMPGADSLGYAGFTDQTNHHFVRTFGAAILMSAVIAATSLSQINGNNASGNGGVYNQPTTAGVLNQALGQQLGQLTAQMIAKNLNVAPTLEIRPGFRFNVMVIKDLSFLKPYEAFDYSLKE